MSLDEGFSKFSLNDFKKLTATPDQLKYVAGKLRELGGGSARVVFALSPKYALKIAFNDRGKSQNETEKRVSSDPQAQEFVAKVHQSAPDSSWIISDLVRPLRDEEEFKDFFGMDFEEFVRAVRGNDHWKWDASNPEWRVSNGSVNADDDSIGTYGLVNAFKKLIKGKKLYEIEFTDIDHWGKAPDNRIVILDYGVDDKNWKEQVWTVEGHRSGQVESQGLSYPGSTTYSEPIVEAFDELKDVIREFVEIVKRSGR